MQKINFINGLESLGTGKTAIVSNPKNGEIICEYCEASNDDVSAAVNAARKAFNLWKNTSLEERAKVLQNAANIILEEQGNPGDLCDTELMHLIIDEMGKSVYEAETEIFESSDILRYFGTEACSFIKDERPMLDQQLWPSKESVLKYNPVGVVGIIKAWNYPLEIPIWSIGAALLCGNTVVFKPSQYSSLIGLYLGKLFQKAGLPDGVLNIIVGDGSVGNALVESDIDMISFTGSTKTGMAIAQKCVSKNIKVALEMGGKDPAIVCDDADLIRTANGIVWGALANAGQVCVSAERIYVHEKIYSEFIDKVLSIVATLKVGDGWERTTDITTLVSEVQLNKVDVQVKDALDKGATLLAGGYRLIDEKYKKGYYYAPTVLTDVTEDMSVFIEETFGPVIAIQKFNDYECVIKKANDSKYGLGASVWTTSSATAKALSDAIDSGMVWINDINLCFPQCPWAGIKSSGVGYDLSKHGLYEYCKVKHINFENDLQPSQPWWYPYNK